MKFAYKFSNLLGSVYKKGNVVFTNDGNSLITPVGNRINIYNLKNNTSVTLPVESRFNYNCISLSPNGNFLIAINEEGEASIISLISRTILHKYQFKRKVRAVKFSPDGKHFAVCKENKVFVFKAPGQIGQYNAFVMERVFHGPFDETTCLDWSSDSKIVVVGSKDMSIKLFPIQKLKNFRVYTLTSHTDIIVDCFFEKSTYDLITISRNGQLCLWECSQNPDDLIPLDPIKRRKINKNNESDEDDIDEMEIIEKTKEITIDDTETKEKAVSKDFFYKKLGRYYLADSVKKTHINAFLSSSTYHKHMKILVVGFSNGAFFIYELPDVNLIHSLTISDQKISTIRFNLSGDWIALGCSGLGQLLVWEWQSETYILKQQGHSNNMCCLTYSSDGQCIATGGDDGKIKLWNNFGHCFVTFNEHTNAISDLCFCINKKFLTSSSLDGTIRAFDIIRYRNFRTFTSPRPIQFSCVSVDCSGEFVAAGGQDIFDIHLWSVKTGKLLEILSGHEGPVGSLSFSPSLTSTILVSVSWDKTIRIWDAIEKGSNSETIRLTSDCICVTFKPNGEEVAVATLDGQISIFNVRTSDQIASIEGRNDLGSGQSEIDIITSKKALQAKAFTSLCYSADGEYILAGGKSKNICIYNVKECLLVKKFEITQNRSLDAVDDFINRRKMTEFGNSALIEERDDGGNIKLKLPGIRKDNVAARVFKPEIQVFCVKFSPTGQEWAAATTEGLLIYSLTPGIIFDPIELQIDISTINIRKAIENEDYLNALTMAIKLNEINLIQQSIEKISIKDVDLIISNLEQKYVERLLQKISIILDNSSHIEFYLIWIQSIFKQYGMKMNMSSNLPTLLALEKFLIKKHQEFSKICDFNKYTMEYILKSSEYINNIDKMDVELDNNDD